MEEMKKNIYKNNEEQLAEKLKNIKAIIEIIDLDAKNYEKALHICKIYDSPEKFRKAFGLIKKFGEKDPMFMEYVPRIEEIYTILLDYQNKGIIDNVNYIIKMESYLNNFKYAKSIIEYYLSSEYKQDSVLFEELGIDQNTFDFCIETIKNLDVNLINQFNEKRKKQKYFANIYTFKNIAFGIRTGKLFDGTPFDLLEFWKLVPFKYSKGIKKDFDEFKALNPEIFFRSDNFYGQIENFTKATMPDESKTILGYMKHNRIYSYRYVSEGQFRKLYSGISIIVNNIYGIPTKIDCPDEAIKKINDNQADTIVGRTTFTSDDANNVIEYMKLHKLPSLIEVFKLVQEKYVRGEINMTEELKKAQEKTTQRILVPMPKKND